MSVKFKPHCRPALIGSLPHNSHATASSLVFENTPQIPLWVQLPVFATEGMVPQFVDGLPGLTRNEQKLFIDSAAVDFDEQLVAFYQDYMDIEAGNIDWKGSRFDMDPAVAPGLYTLIEKLSGAEEAPAAVKGQVTGPFTFATGVTDENDRALFYNDQLRDAVVKMLALKARRQVQLLRCGKAPVMVFLDEPALAGFGSSAFISISRQEVTACLDEIIAAIHSENALAGVHVCANTDWSLILDGAADVVSFDAYGFFDKFILFKDQIAQFLNRGGLIAWGIVPTGDADVIQQETTASLLENWQTKMAHLEALGFDRHQITAQALITPSCGTGSLTEPLALRVLKLTGDLSAAIRNILS